VREGISHPMREGLKREGKEEKADSGSKKKAIAEE